MIGRAAAPLHGVVWVAFFKTWKPDEVTIAFDPRRYYLYDAFEGVNYELDVSKEPPPHQEPQGPERQGRDDTDTLWWQNNYRATTQLLTAADIFLPGEELPGVVGDRCARRRGWHPRAAGRVHIRTVKGGTIEPAS